MGTGGKIILGLVGLTIIGGVAYVGYTNYWNMPKLVSALKGSKKMVIRFRGKNINVDVADLSKTGQSMMLGGVGSDWSLVPSYGNESDKSTLNGLLVEKGNGVIYRTFYF